jgi:tetratricopeptide (TPR) repeat protein
MEKENSIKKQLAAVEDILTRAACADMEDERNALLATARALAIRYLESAPDDPEFNYAAGLVMYNSFVEDEPYGSLAEKYLGKAIDLEPSHQFARLYLGHYYYDTGQYGKALSCFEMVDAKVFLALNQKWRLLKLQELMLCCKLRLQPQSITEDDFRTLIREYIKSSPEDAPVPSELLRVLAETKESPVWQIVNRNLIRDLVVEMVERLGFGQALRDLIAVI